jgi:hypothetical protein
LVITRAESESGETHLYLEKFSARVLPALQEGQVLARENVVEMLVRGHGLSLCSDNRFAKSSSSGAARPAVASSTLPVTGCWQCSMAPLAL